MTTGSDDDFSRRSGADDAFGWVAERSADPYASGPSGADPYATPGYADAGPYDPYAVPSDPYANPAAPHPVHSDPYAGARPPQGPPQYGAFPPPPSSGSAIAGFVLGIVGLAFCGGLTAPFGIFFSARGMKETAPTEAEPQGGRGLAVAGLVLSLLGLIPLLFMLLYVVAMIFGLVLTATG